MENNRPEFWNSLLTEQSWNLLKELSTKPFKFAVIGGWATYLWTRQHKSKDIDILLFDFKDLEYLRQNFNLVKNDSLKKYEIKSEDFDVDIYVPHYSVFPIPPEEMLKHVTLIENIKVVSPEILLITKQEAEKDREHSVKGIKDRIDILSILIFTGVNFSLYHELLRKYEKEEFLGRLRKIISYFSELKYFGLNPREYKLKKKELLKKLGE